MRKAKKPLRARRGATAGSRGTSAGPRRPARSARRSGPPHDVETGWARKVNEVTTPKLPPPPRSAQKRSGCSSALARDARAVGQHHARPRAGCRSSARSLRVRWPMPPAEGQAADAGRRDDPAGVGEAVLVGGGVDLAPGASAADADRAACWRRPRPSSSGERSMTTPSSQMPSPAPLWPPPRTASGSPWRAGEATIAATSFALGAPGDERGPAVDHRVVDGAGSSYVVVRAVRSAARRGRARAPGGRPRAVGLVVLMASSVHSSTLSAEA